MQLFCLLIVVMGAVAEFLPGLSSKALRNGDSEPAMTKKFRIYGMKYCPFTERVQLYLSRKNFEVDVVNINLADKPEWYTKKHQKGTVPTLQLGDTIIGRDSMKIAELLDVIKPEDAVLPDDEDKRNEELKRASELSKKIVPYLGAMKKHGTGRNQTEEMWKEVAGKPKEARLVLQPILEKYAYLSGEKAGFTDYMLYPVLERFWILENMWQEKMVPPSPTPEFSAWFKRMSDLPEVARIRQPLEDHIQHFETVFAGRPDYDLEANSLRRQ